MTQRELQIHTRVHQVLIPRWCSLLGSKFAQIIFRIMMMAFFYQLVLRYTGDEVQSPVQTSINVPSQPFAQEEIFVASFTLKTDSHLRDQQDKRERKSSCIEDVSFEFPNWHSHAEQRVCTFLFGP